MFRAVRLKRTGGLNRCERGLLVPSGEAHPKFAAPTVRTMSLPSFKLRFRLEQSGSSQMPNVTAAKLISCFHLFNSSDANAFRTLDLDKPNCRAIRDGAMPAVKAERTAFT